MYEDIRSVMSEDSYMAITTISDLTGYTVPEVSGVINDMVKNNEVEFIQEDASLRYKLA